MEEKTPMKSNLNQKVGGLKVQAKASLLDARIIVFEFEFEFEVVYLVPFKFKWINIKKRPAVLLTGSHGLNGLNMMAAILNEEQ